MSTARCSGSRRLPGRNLRRNPAHLSVGCLSGVVLLRAAAALLFSYAPASEVSRLADPQLTESSGVSASGRSDDVVFTHNDSGDSPRVFAVDIGSGATVSTFEVEDARADDWEDMARGLTEDGRPALFLADIGDNFARRRAVVVYEIAEPPVPVPGAGPALVRSVARHELRYDDGPHDAETLLVDPGTRALFVVTKDRDGVSGVYRAEPDGTTLHRVGEIRFDALVKRAGAYAKAATAGDVSPDGRRVVVRTPFEAFEWDIGGSGLVTAFNGTPRRIPLPTVEQGEAIAYTRDGRSLVTTSEGRGAPVHVLRGDHEVGPDLLAPRPPVTTGPGGGRTPWAAWLLGLVSSFGAMAVLRARRGRRRRRRPPPGQAARPA